MKWLSMSSPTPSVDSLSGAPTLGSFVDQNELGLGLELQNGGCHGSSSSSSTCSSIVFPHLSLPNSMFGSMNGTNMSNGFGGNHTNGDFNVGFSSSSPTGLTSIKCSICHETFTRPKVLPCFHTFCQDCLEKSQDHSMDRILCPTCRQECPLTSQGVGALLTDYGMLQLLEKVPKSGEDVKSEEKDGVDGERYENFEESDRGSSEVSDSFKDFESNGSRSISPTHNELNNNKPKIEAGRYCTGCKSKESIAVAHCHDCTDFLCCNCVMAHQFMHCFEGHRITNYVDENYKDNIGSVGNFGQEKQVSCTQHKGEVLQYFCRTCSVPVCSECVATDHPKSMHDCEILSECQSKYVKQLSQYIYDFRMKSLDLHDVFKSFETASSRLQSQYVKAQSEITDAFASFRKMLDERKNDLMKELESLYSTRQVTLSVVSQRIQETMDRVYQTIEFGDRLLRCASPPQILVFKKLLESRLQLLAAVPEPTLAIAAAAAGDLEFVANYSAMQAAIKNTMGYIRSGVMTGEAINTFGTKQSPAPIARPGGPQMNGYQSNSNGISSLSSSLNSASSLSCSTNNGQGMLDSSMSSNGSMMLSNKRLGPNNSATPTPTPYSSLDLGSLNYEKWSNGCETQTAKDYGSNGLDFMLSNNSIQTNDALSDLTCKLMPPIVFSKALAIKRQKMIYHCKFGEFGTAEAQFTEPSGVAVNANNEIIVADTNNHRIQIFDKEGRFKFQFGECGKRDGQLLYPNRVAVVKHTGDIVVTERSPTHQIQIYNQYGQFVRKFGANILQHPRGVTVDNKGRIIVVECKVMRVIIFDQTGAVLHKFGCSKHLEFPNGVVVNDRQEIFISDNRAHCVKVFSYEGHYLRQIGGEGATNYPIGVGINSNGEILVADNHNNFNLTIFTQDGQLVSALESKVKHAQCFDVALMDDGSVVLASKDYRLYIYRYAQVPPPPLGI